MAEPWWTDPRGAAASAGPRRFGGSPSLAFHKWHAYDSSREGPVFPPEAKGSSPAFLAAVARAMSSFVADSAVYEAWLRRYREALEALGVSWSALPKATTDWRLAVGLGTNPALDVGLALHPLLGFPWIPGSAVKGLVRHVAEASLLQAEPRRAWIERFEAAEAEGVRPPLEDGDEVEAFVSEAEELRGLLGSLSVARGGTREDPRGWLPPRALLEAWARHPAAPKAWGQRLRSLLEHTGGRARFYDAVPRYGQEEVVAPDLMNPHYPDFARSSGLSYPPSDDQNPVPVQFLTVGPAVKLVFPFRLVDSGPPAEAAPRWGETEIRRWLTTGLTDIRWGAGGKTTAGYGFLSMVGETPARRRFP